ncbi:winged helix-turn-helix domain-containing protein [Pelagibacterales bacterium SAG-MED05]|nr:winged helix-turn-helix domain-containing protein [Pelagibacterales bacterium SAG-MED05]
MHKINVLSFGSKNFNISLEELKDHLNFNLTTIDENIDPKSFESYDVLFCHQDFLKENSSKEILKNTNKIKILAHNLKDKKKDFFNDRIYLPVKFQEINHIIENSVVKKNFSYNSSIQIKNYILDKNEKKLFKDQTYVLLTEKEIQLLELFLSYNKAISKNKILDEVWKYSEDADTHTVETHIYRLRKKIKSKFSDENFILNNKDGYLL